MKQATGRPPKNDNLAGKRGPGRPKGMRNKQPRLLQQAILMAVELEGDELVPNGGIVAWLRSQARENPAPFMGLLGKVLPLQVAISGTVKTAVVTDKVMTPEEWAEQWQQHASIDALNDDESNIVPIS
jgi:hypothetical protein|tara:strand:+ start:125 stop:508 length:384 start_codon:yes stop_codon:yes gene_type:complete